MTVLIMPTRVVFFSPRVFPNVSGCVAVIPLLSVRHLNTKTICFFSCGNWYKRLVFGCDFQCLSPFFPRFNVIHIC